MKNIFLICALLFCVAVIYGFKPVLNLPIVLNGGNVLRYEGKVANPLLIYAFLPLPGERPSTISIDFNGGNNRFFINQSIDSTTIDVMDGKRFNYTLIGKTSNNIYVVLTKLTNGVTKSQSLLFFSFQNVEKIYDDTTKANQLLIVLERFYSFNNGQDVAVTITGNKVDVGLSGTEKKHIELNTDNDNGSQVILDNSYPPVGVATSMLQKDWEDVNARFYFHGNPINPYLLNELAGAGFFLSDGPSTMVVDLETGSVSKEYEDTALKKTTGYNTEINDHGYVLSSSFKYEYLGKTANGVHVVRTIEWGGGSGVFCNIQFIRFKLRKKFDSNGVLKDELLMCLQNFYPEGDRNNAVVTIKGNTVKLDIPERTTPVDEAMDTTHVVFHF